MSKVLNQTATNVRFVGKPKAFWIEVQIYPYRTIYVKWLEVLHLSSSPLIFSSFSPLAAPSISSITSAKLSSLTRNLRHKQFQLISLPHKRRNRYLLPSFQHHHSAF